MDDTKVGLLRYWITWCRRFCWRRCLCGWRFCSLWGIDQSSRRGTMRTLRERWQRFNRRSRRNSCPLFVCIVTTGVTGVIVWRPTTPYIHSVLSLDPWGSVAFRPQARAQWTMYNRSLCSIYYLQHTLPSCTLPRYSLYYSASTLHPTLPLILYLLYSTLNIP